MTEKEYNICVTEYADNVYRFIVKNLRHEEDARDVVQTAFEKMWRNRESIDAEKSKSYLFTVAYHQMIDHLRKTKRIQLKEDFSEETRVTNHTVHNAKKILEEELVMLEQSKLIPDASIHFNKKEVLMKEESDASINMNNYQEWLVLYVDNELNKEEKIAVEKFLGAHPKIQQELELFQRTKL